MNPARPSIRVAVCQTLVIDGDESGNLRRIDDALDQAAAGGAALACFPESAILGWINPEAHDRALPVPGRITEHLAKRARQTGLFIAIGMDEKAGERLYDAAVLMDPDGGIALKHRKIHNLPEERLMDPPYADGRPEDVAVVDTSLGRVGLLICADTFREDLLARMAALRPDLLVVPYGWAAEPRAWPEHGRELRRVVQNAARAVGCPVVGTDCVGGITHGPWAGRTYGGQSVVADARGGVLAVLRDRDAEVRLVEVTPGRGAAA